MRFQGIFSLREIKKQYPNAQIYAMQSKQPDGSWIFDPFFGMPMLRIDSPLGVRLVAEGDEIEDQPWLQEGVGA